MNNITKQLTKNLHFLLSGLALVGTLTVHAQVSKNTQQINRVYSRYGTGVMSPAGNYRNQAMGGTGIAGPGHFSINWLNPALLTYNDAVSFELNVQGDFRNSTDANGTIYSDNETSINSIRFALPVFRNKWQTSVGVRPYSKVNYGSFSRELVGNTEDSVYNYIHNNGQGSVNQFSWQNSFRILKNLNLGIDMSYYFGHVFANNVSYIRTENGLFKYATDVQNNRYIVDQGSQLSQDIRYNNFNGLSSTIGVSYLQKMDSLPFDIFLGATYDAYSSLNSKIDNQLYKPGSVDSMEYTNEHSIPKGLGIGAAFVFKDTFNIQRYMVEINYSTKEYYDLQNSRISLGFEKLPNPNASNWLQRNLYRAGGYWNQNALLFGNTGVDEFGITFGLGMPSKRGNFGGKRSIFDFGITAGQHGTVTNGGIKEQFIRLNLGITFNDRWFQQIRID